MSQSNKRFQDRGFSLIEVLLALAVLGIVLAAIAMIMTSSMRQNLNAGNRSQAAQIMNYFGRRIAGGEISQLGGTAWGYGTLATEFRDLSRESNLADTDRYRAEVAQLPRIGIATSTIPHYRITVCWTNADDESCVIGDTAGPAPGGASGESLPGIN